MSHKLEVIKKLIDKEVGYDIGGKLRKREAVYARAVYFKIGREVYPKMSFAELGKSLNRDHATVLHALKKVMPHALEHERFNLLAESLRYSLSPRSDKKSVAEYIVENNSLYQQNVELTHKLATMIQENRFLRLVEQLDDAEKDEVYYKLDIFVRSIKSRVYLCEKEKV